MKIRIGNVRIEKKFNFLFFIFRSSAGDVAPMPTARSQTGRRQHVALDRVSGGTDQQPSSGEWDFQ